MTVRLRPADSRASASRAAGWWSDRLIGSYLVDVAVKDPDRLAVIDGTVELSYRDLDQRISAVTAGLQELGVRPGEVVSWQLPNWHEALALHHAIMRAGAVSNPIIPIYRQRELAYILAEARSRVFVMPETFRGHSYADTLADIRSDLPDLEHVLVCRSSGASGLPPFDQLIDGSGKPHAVARSADDPMLLLFTSGTTARPKGAVHTHNTLDYENRSMIDTFGMTGEDVVFMPSPVSHITGLLYGLQLPAMLGTTVVFQDTWDAGEALRLIQRYRCSVTVAATPFLHGLTYHSQLASFDVSSLRVFACGGADVPAGLIRDARDRLGCWATRLYGSTEFPTLSTSAPGDAPAKAATTDGRLIGAAQFRVVDDQDQPVSAGEQGELIVTGPELFLGYQRAEDNQGAFTDDGWFRTGDLASFDADGFITIRGRKKDIILRGGENISVAEVEDLLFDHPAVEEIAVVAMPDPVMVERACAYVVVKNGAQVTLPDLAEYLVNHGVAKQKIPERLEVIDALPKTQSGKVQKFRLRELIRQTLDRELSTPSR